MSHEDCCENPCCEGHGHGHGHPHRDLESHPCGYTRIIGSAICNVEHFPGMLRCIDLTLDVHVSVEKHCGEITITGLPSDGRLAVSLPDAQRLIAVLQSMVDVGEANIRPGA